MPDKLENNRQNKFFNSSKLILHMKNPIIIGDKVFNFKKAALSFYRNILNSYKFGESLSDEHYSNLIDLINYDYSCETQECSDTFNSPYFLFPRDVRIDDIRIAKAQYGVKCFEVVFSDLTTCFISYIYIINRKKYSPDMLFNIACRSAVYSDIRNVKIKYFSENSINGYAKCQETGAMCKWEDLVVDHRQPNTFSIIVDRFKELNHIDTNDIEYCVNDNNVLIFSDSELVQTFMEYHKQKANLRIVRKENNLSRTATARLKPLPKDLRI